MSNVYGIVLGSEGKIYYFNGNDLELKKEDKVVVETEKGIQLGTVSYKLENKKINIAVQIKIFKKRFCNYRCFKRAL